MSKKKPKVKIVKVTPVAPDVQKVELLVEEHPEPLPEVFAPEVPMPVEELPVEKKSWWQKIW